jgi:hypothetical protein
MLGENAHKALTRLGERDNTGLGQPRIRLKEWMLQHQVTAGQMAMMCCLNVKSLHALLRGGWRSKGGYIQLHQAFAIEWATKGYVPAWLWLDDEYNTARIRASRMSHVKDFEERCKVFVLKYNVLKTPDGMLREKARVLSRLFNVQWSELKARIWLEAERKAAHEKADISYLLEPDDDTADDNGIIVSDKHPEMTDEEWFLKILEDSNR